MEQDNKRPLIQDTDIPDLEALKGALEHREALKIKAERIRETALSRIKARERASRRRSNEKTPDESTTSGGGARRLSASTNTVAKEKSDQLKRKLEEARAKVESMRGQENLGKVNEVVESIRVQIEDREKVLQQMLTTHSAKPAADEPQTTTDMEPVIPDQVKQKLADLEAQVLDLQENLREKDSVLAARTQAITLLSEDMSRKSRARIDHLEETQQQMRQMQANFVLIEERMRQEHLKLQQQADQRKQRCVEAEKSLRQSETARFDLSTRVAELQQRLAALQEQNAGLQEQAKERDEMKESLDAANKQTIKLKAQFKAKMKAVEEERDTLKKMSESGEEVNRLQNRIAELEEEKELCNTLKARIEELEKKTEYQNVYLDCHVQLISQLENEKLDLIEGAQEQAAMLAEKDALIARLQEQLAEVGRVKVAAEMRAAQLEEKLDLDIREQRRADDADEGRLENMRNELLKSEETVAELQAQLAAGASALDEWKAKYFGMQRQYNAMTDAFQQLESRVADTAANNASGLRDCAQLRRTVSELESSFERMLERGIGDEELVESERNPPQREPSPLMQQVGELQQLRMFMEDVESSAAGMDREGCMRVVEFLRRFIGELESCVARINPEQANEELVNRDVEVERLRHELQAATEEMHRLQSLVEELTSNSAKLDELNRKMDEKDRELQETCSELEVRSRKLSEYKKFHKLKSEDVIRVSHELETLTADSQQRIARLEEELAKARDTICKMQAAGSSGGSVDKSVEAGSSGGAGSADKSVETGSSDGAGSVDKSVEAGSSGGAGSVDKSVEQKMKKLAANLKLKVKLCKELEAKVAEMEGQLKRVADERNDVVRCMEEKQNVIEDLNSANKKLGVELSELRNLMAELRSQAVGGGSCGADETVDQLRAEIGDWMESVRTRSQQAELKLQEKDVYIESLECELNKSRERVREIECSVEERRRSLEEKAESLGIRLLQAETANEEFERQGGELERQLAYLAENENYLQTSLINSRNENDGLTRTVQDLNAQIEKLVKDVENGRNSIVHLQKELAAAREVQEAYNQNIEELDRLNTANKQMKAGKEKLVLEFEQREKQLLENVEEEMRTLNEKMENERQDLRRRLEAESALKKALEQQISDLEMRCEEANSKLLQTDVNRIGAQEIMAEQKELMENLKVEFENREVNYRTQIRQLQEYNAELVKSVDAIEHNATGLTRELSRVGVELDAMRADQSRSQQLQAELDALKQMVRKGVDEVVSEAESRVMLLGQQHEAFEKQQEVVEQQVQQVKQQEVLETMPTLFTFPTTNEPSDDPFSRVEPPVASAASFFQPPPPPPPPKSPESREQLILELEAKLSSALEENQRLGVLVEGAGLGVGGAASSRDEEDGWGWGGDEGMAATQSPLKRSSHQDVERRLAEYEADNRRLADELRESNLKCAKLLKKAKELKSKSEHLERDCRQRSVGFEDLDFAMQEELRERIGVLEKSLQEAQGEAKAWKTERENLTRRVDTLTSGNERLVEMKERQDVEVAMWQKQNAELKQHIQGLEWRIAELTDETHIANPPDVQDKLDSLTAENEQLMKVLAEMKDQATTRLQPDDDQHLKQQVDNLQQLYNQAQTDLEELTRHNANILSANEAISGRFDAFKVEIEELAADNEKLRGELSKIEDISAKYSTFGAEFEQLKNENSRIVLLEEENKLMKDIVATAEEQLKAYKNKLNENEKNLAKIDENYANMKREFDRLMAINQENSELLEKLRLENCELSSAADEYKKRLEDALKKRSGSVAEEEPQQFAPVLFEGFKSAGNAAEANDPFSALGEEQAEKTELVDEIVKTNQHEQEEEDLKELKEEVCNLNTLLDEKEDELEITLQSVDSIRLERENLEDEWNEKFKNLNTKNTSATVVKAEAFRDQLNVARKKFQNELLLKEEEIAHLTCELSAKQQLLMNSATELETVQTEAEKALIKLREVEGQLEERNLEFDKLRHELDCLRGEYSSLQRALDEKARYIEGLELTRQEAEVCREELLLVQSQLKEALSGNEVLREKRSNVDDSFYDLEYQLRKELDEKSASLKEMLQKNSEADVKLSEWERVASEKDVKLSELERTLFEKEARLSELEAIAYEKDVKLSDWERYASEKDVKIAEWERYASEKDGKLSEWEKYASEKDVKLIEMETVLSEKEGKLSSFKQAYTECYDQLQKSENTVKSLEESVQALKPAPRGGDTASIRAMVEATMEDDVNWKEYLMTEVERCRQMIAKRDLEIVRLTESLVATKDSLSHANEAVHVSSYGSVQTLKQRLDEALYTLHVRDLRCEELTHELLQLLAERDELQLRLSASIKMNESSRGRIEHMEKSPAESADSSAESSDQVNPPQAYVLTEKLGELQQTDYRKDLSLQRDRELRYIEHKHLYSGAPPDEQQHEQDPNPSFFGWLFGSSK
ncbi:golgin subfamily B member 1 isoform X2 [Nilaparvata lugens]|uniref:golgin subfamily B member 1 isoform X2 n=1 Tax=Nilaparvata lugens TaxID=108931 RepID=UPI00193D428E|nr:golgin subfamily B member 1 isoform X2 [Nilaparvata lugens]